MKEKTDQFLGKIYLDQKDYSRIAKGLSGDTKFKDDVEAYYFLAPFVKSQKIFVYGSWCHLYEALRYDEGKIKLLSPYCEAIDTLTQGKCIIWPETIEKRELELFFAKHFGFESKISEDEYPYGNPIDLIFIDHIYDTLIDPKESLKKELDSLPLSGKEKKYCLKQFSKPKRLRRLLEKFPEENLRLLCRQFPGFEKTFTKDKLLDFLLSSPKEKAMIFKDALKNTFTFKNLVTYYSPIFPQLKVASHCFDESSTKLRGFIKMSQVLYDIFDKQVTESKLSKIMVERFVNNLNKEIIELANKFQFPINEAKELLQKTEFEHLTSIRAMKFFIIEYYKRHKGSYERGRNPLEGDVMDLHHLRNFPYRNGVKSLFLT